MVSANDRQVGGSHYQAHGTATLQHWDVVTIFKLDYFQAQISRYLFRWKNKNGLEDLEKARHYMDKYIEVHKQFLNTTTEAPPTPDAVVDDTCQCGHLMDEHSKEYGCMAVIDEDGGSRPCPCEVGMGEPSTASLIVEEEAAEQEVEGCGLELGPKEPLEGSLNVSEFGDVEVADPPAPRCLHCSHLQHDGACASTHCECYTTQGGEPNAAESRARDTNCPSCHHPTRLHVQGSGCIHRFSENIGCNCSVVY